MVVEPLAVAEALKEGRGEAEARGEALGLAVTELVRDRERVLVVEDEPLVAFDHEHILSQAGYRIAATVDSHTHAARVIDAGSVDLVVTDINLRGGRCGIEVARHAHARQLPVLFVTGACPADARSLAVGCLAKPFAPRDLLAAIAVVDAVLAGRAPPRKPRGMKLFAEIA
jgi:DNA-binding response OmpR family regulator